MALIADVYSGAIVAPSAALISSKSELAEDAETDSHPSYSFSYSVDDVTTGDHKSQYESREGDSVVGRVSLLIRKKQIQFPFLLNTNFHDRLLLVPLKSHFLCIFKFLFRNVT